MKKFLLLALCILFSVGCSTTIPSQTPSPSPSIKITPTVEVTVIVEDQNGMNSYKNFYTPLKEVLFWTGQVDFKKSRDFFNKTKKAWDVFYSVYKDKAPMPFYRSDHWVETLSQINATILEAGKLIGSKKITDAHDRFEKIRISLFSLRKENLFSEYADILNDFHNVMEDMLAVQTKEAYAEKNAELQMFSQTLAKNPPQGMTTTDQQQFVEMNTVLLAAVEESTATIQQGMTFEECMKKAQLIKEAYTKLFLRFG